MPSNDRFLKRLRKKAKRGIRGPLRDGAVRASRHWRGCAKPPVPIPAESELEQMAFAVPPMVPNDGSVGRPWHRIDAAFDVELAVANLTVQELL